MITRKPNFHQQKTKALKMPLKYRILSAVWCSAITGLILSSNLLAAGLQYLKIPVFARSEGMAGAYTGIAIGPEAILYNPAGLAFEEKRKH